MSDTVVACPASALFGYLYQIWECCGLQHSQSTYFQLIGTWSALIYGSGAVTLLERTFGHASSANLCDEELYEALAVNSQLLYVSFQVISSRHTMPP